jgi:catechol 2,3-dioxygenase
MLSDSLRAMMLAKFALYRNNMSQTQAETKTEFSIHSATKIGSVSLTVANLDNQIDFYQKALGFQLHEREGNWASLGTGERELLHLVEQPSYTRYQRVTGLYHFAVLFPDRRELARVMARLFALKYRNYPTDHIMTKTTYLDDLEGNGIELYCESPEDGTWSLKDGEYITRRKDGSLSDGRETLDVEALFGHLKEDDRLDTPVPAETRVGHVHLHVRDLHEAVDFYHGVIGFDVMGKAKAMQAAFVSAGGYHHHIGLNTWQGEGAPPPPADALGLRYFAVELPDQSALDEVIARVDEAGIPANQTEDGLLLYDPSQNGMLLTKNN